MLGAGDHGLFLPSLLLLPANGLAKDRREVLFPFFSFLTAGARKKDSAGCAFLPFPFPQGNLSLTVKRLKGESLVLFSPFPLPPPLSLRFSPALKELERKENIGKRRSLLLFPFFLFYSQDLPLMERKGEGCIALSFFPSLARASRKERKGDLRRFSPPPFLPPEKPVFLRGTGSPPFPPSSSLPAQGCTRLEKMRQILSLSFLPFFFFFFPLHFPPSSDSKLKRWCFSLFLPLSPRRPERETMPRRISLLPPFSPSLFSSGAKTASPSARPVVFTASSFPPLSLSSPLCHLDVKKKR